MASEIDDRDSADSFLLSMSSGRTSGISQVTVIDGIYNYDLFEWIYSERKSALLAILQGTRFTQIQEVSDGQSKKPG